MDSATDFPRRPQCREAAIFSRLTDSVRRQLGLRRNEFRDWRRDPRYRVELDAELDGAQCSLEDISIGGARVVIRKEAAPRIGDPVRLVFTLAGCGHSLGGVVLRSSGNGLSMKLGIAFAGDQADAIDLLASSLTDLDVARAG